MSQSALANVLVKKVPRAHQEYFLSEIKRTRESKQPEIVIAGCPSAGKTFVAITDMIRNPKLTYLVLTHGQTNLRKQWGQAFKDEGVEASTTPGECRITYTLPHSRREIKASKLKVDTLIIDEAHHFTSAKMVQEIIKQVKPKLIIYITGTPENFVLQKHTNIVCVDALELKDICISDIHFGMVTTKAKIKNSDYTQDGEVRTSSKMKFIKSSSTDIDGLILTMTKRMTEIEGDKDFSVFPKTMIACHSIEHANKIAKEINSRNIVAVSSNSDNDIGSKQIDRFVKEPEIRVLTVVGRGVLGFDFPELVNIFDLTGTRNPSKMYQMFMRSGRQSDTVKQKYFFKFMPEENIEIMVARFNAAYHLMDKNWLLKFNGKNFGELDVLVRRDILKQLSSKSSGEKPKLKRKLFVDDYFYTKFGGMEFLNRIKDTPKVGTQEVAWISLGEAVSKLTGKQNRDIKGKKIRLLRLAAVGNKPSNFNYDTNPIAAAFYRYINPNNKLYDPVFVKEMENTNSTWLLNKTEMYKRELLTMAINGFSRPVKGKSKLGDNLVYFTSKKHRYYDERFDRYLRKIRPDWFRNLAPALRFNMEDRTICAVLTWLLYFESGMVTDARRRAALRGFLRNKPEFDSYFKGFIKDEMRRPVINLVTGNVFDSISAAGRSVGRTPAAIRDRINLDIVDRLGNRWAYYDENNPEHVKIYKKYLKSRK